MIDISDISKALPRLSTSVNYWFFRTMGGDYYTDFLKNGFIAIGHNEITLDMIMRNSDPGDPKGEEHKRLGKTLKELYKFNKHDYWAKMHYKFAFEMSKGDVVIIPSYSSQYIAIGVITSNEIVLENVPHSNVDNPCRFIKRRKIQWIDKDINKKTLNYNLIPLFYSRHVITDANYYSEYIDFRINDLYFKDDEVRYALSITKKDEINAYGFLEFYNNLLFLVEDMSQFHKLEFSKEEISAKFNLESPGVIVFGGAVVGGLILLAAYIALAGGELTFEIDPKTGKTKFGLKAESLLKAISDYKNSKQERKERTELFERQLKQLDVRPSETLESLLKINEDAKPEKMRRTKYPEKRSSGADEFNDNFQSED